VIAMRLAIHFLGVEVFHISTDPAPDAEPEDEDRARDLSGGLLGSTSVEAGGPDVYLGFTNAEDR
jgi:hypothetical protein